MTEFIGVDIGGTHIKAVRVNAEGLRLDQRERPTPPERGALVAAIREVVVAMSADLPGGDADGLPGVGISSPGLAARDQRTIAWMQGRMESVQGLDWSAALGGLSSTPVKVLNDAHAATLGEAWLGAARGFSDVVLLTLGTGIGGGILVGGQLLRGHLGRAGHLGHLCLDIDGPPDICSTPGSLEEAVADCGVLRRSAGRFETTREVVESAANGDPEAAEIWSRAIRSLACGIATIINAVDPEIVVLGGGIIAAGDSLFVPLRETMEEVEWRPHGAVVSIVPAELGTFAGALGAARNVMPSVGASDITS